MSNENKKRSITIHPQIIFKIIDSQSGTLGKAFSEYVMNSIDASGSRVDVEITSEGFRVSDDGPGFHGLEEIESFFETLGFPHDDDDHRTYGSFGIGRAQMWSFASTVWRTNEFAMTVDIKKNGLDYDLKTGLENKIGCEITGRFYNAMSPLEINEALNELKALIRYVDTPVFVNGVQLNKKPSDEKWTSITDDAYIKKSSAGPLRVYNLGVLVREYSAHHLGLSGIVVSKKQLKLNMARNDIILTKCEVWKRVKKELEDEALKTNKTKTRLTSDERINLIERFKSRSIKFNDAIELKLITDISGRQRPISDLARCGRYGDNKKFTVAPTVDSVIGGKAHDKKLMYVLSPKTLNEFNVESVDELVELINSLHPIRDNECKGGVYNYIKKDAIGKFELLESLISDTRDYISNKQLSREETLAMYAIGRLSAAINDITSERNEYGQIHYRTPRKLKVGISETAEAWTDGQSFIALNQKLINEARQGVSGFMRIALVLVHEYCHKSDDMGDHAHDFEFYNEYHDFSIDTDVFRHAVLAAQSYATTLARENIKILKPALKDQQADFHLNQAYEDAIVTEHNDEDEESEEQSMSPA